MIHLWKVFLWELKTRKELPESTTKREIYGGCISLFVFFASEQPLNCVPTGQMSKVTHNKFFALLQRRGAERWLKYRMIKMSRKGERASEKKQGKDPVCWRKQRGYNHFKTEEIEATLLGAKQRWRGRRRADPRGRVILDLEAARPAWDSDTKTALSSLLPLHSLTTGYDAASSGARPDSHRRKQRDGRPEEEVGRELEK